MLSSQLVRNNLTESQIEYATVISIDRKSESVLLRVEEYNHVRYKAFSWVMLSYETGQHSITTFEEEMCSRVIEHWKGFKENALEKHEEFLKRIILDRF